MRRGAIPNAYQEPLSDALVVWLISAIVVGMASSPDYVFTFFSESVVLWVGYLILTFIRPMPTKAERIFIRAAPITLVFIAAHTYPLLKKIGLG